MIEKKHQKLIILHKDNQISFFAMRVDEIGVIYGEIGRNQISPDACGTEVCSSFK